MVIGGVIEDQESSNNGGIPILKDIPLIGILFRRGEDERKKTNLYFFVTPTILDEDDFQDLYYVSLNKKLEAKDYIGDRRLQIIDKRYTPNRVEEPRTLEDVGATYEDLDRQGGYELGGASRRSRAAATGAPSAPSAPGAPGSQSNPANPNGSQPQ
jgi:hypothetical protein